MELNLCYQTDNSNPFPESLENSLVLQSYMKDYVSPQKNMLSLTSYPTAATSYLLGAPNFQKDSFV